MPFVRKARPLSDPNLRKPNAGLTKYEKVIYDIYTKALNGVRNQLGDKKVLDDIIDALKANSAARVPNALNWRTFVISLDKTVPTLTAQIAAMANLHSKNLPKKIRYEYNFESKDPRAIAWAQTQAGKRIQGITLETQQAVANLIADGLRTKLTREEIIAQLRQTVGLDKRQSRALGTFYERRLNKYLEDGMTYEQAAIKAEKEGNKYRVRLVKQRAIRIARTEISAATNAGRYLSWLEADERDLLPIGSKKRWVTARDERTCDICAPMNGVEIDWEMPFSTGDQMPPPHPNCRCTAVIVPSEAPILKHAPGKHNQQNHAGGRGGKVYNDLKEFVIDQRSEHPVDSQAYDEKIDKITLSQTGPNGELLPSENRMAVLAYQGNIGYKINEALRDPQISETGYQKYIDGLDKTIASAPALSQKITVYRGVQSNVGRDNEFWRSMEVGDVIEDKGFVSTSLRPSLAADFAYYNQSVQSQGFVFKMDLPAGTKGVFPSSVLGLDGGMTRTEAEFLLPRGSKFEILSKEGKVWELGLVND